MISIIITRLIVAMSTMDPISIHSRSKGIVVNESSYDVLAIFKSKQGLLLHSFKMQPIEIRMALV